MDVEVDFCEPSSSTADAVKRTLAATGWPCKRPRTCTLYSEAVSSTTASDSVIEQPDGEESRDSNMSNGSSNGGSVASSSSGQNAVEQLEQKHLNELLVLIFTSARQSAENLVGSDNYGTLKTAIEPIRQKCLEDVYSTCDEFYSDLMAVEAKFKRAAKQKAATKSKKLKGSGNSTIFDGIHGMVLHFQEEMKMAKYCVDCVTCYYLHGPEFFEKVCREPHSLVWAKFNSEPYWPGKVLTYSHSRRKFYVRFFGEHSYAWVKPSLVYLVTTRYPWAWPKSPSLRIRFQKAVIEMDSHVDEINEMFKGFKVVYGAEFEHLDISRINLVTDYHLEDDEPQEPSSSKNDSSEVDNEQISVDSRTRFSGLELDAFSNNYEYQPFVKLENECYHRLLSERPELFIDLDISSMINQSVNQDLENIKPKIDGPSLPLPSIFKVPEPCSPQPLQLIKPLIEFRNVLRTSLEQIKIGNALEVDVLRTKVDKVRKNIEHERELFIESLENDTHPILMPMVERLNEIEAEAKLKFWCCMCFKEAVERWSPNAEQMTCYCSKECLDNSRR